MFKKLNENIPQSFSRPYINSYLQGRIQSLMTAYKKKGRCCQHKLFWHIAVQILFTCTRAGVANLFVREGHLIFLNMGRAHY